MKFHFMLRTKMLWIPVSILIVAFILMGAVFSKLMITNSNETLRKDMFNMIETEKKQLISGLSIISSTQLVGDAMMGLEGNDPEIANDLIKQVSTMGLNAIYFTDLKGNVIHPKGVQIAEELKQKLKVADHAAGLVGTSMTDAGMCAYAPIIDVETATGFLVFHVDIAEKMREYAVQNLDDGGEDRNALVSQRIENFYNTVTKDHEAFLKRMLFMILLILSPSLIVIVFVLGTSSNKIVNRINRLLDAFNRQAEGDLTQEVIIKSDDEISELTRAFNQTNKKLSRMMHNITSHSDTISVSATQLSGVSQNIASDAEEQYEKTVYAANSMQELGISFIDVAKHTGSASDSAREANDIATKGGDVVEETIAGMDRISKSVNESSTTIEALGKRSQEIGEIVEVINDIAGQTNLLALNAAIEAARAGEQGRGFAVVADEVRKLAERTTSATSEIGDMIKGIQDDTGKAVESMHAGTKEVDNGVELAHQAGEALTQILESVQNVTEVIRLINDAIQTQSVASDEITVNIDSVSNITKTNIDNTKTSLESIVHLTQMADILKDLVNGFQLQKEDIERNTDLSNEQASQEEQDIDFF